MNGVAGFAIGVALAGIIFIVLVVFVTIASTLHDAAKRKAHFDRIKKEHSSML